MRKFLSIIFLAVLVSSCDILRGDGELSFSSKKGVSEAIEVKPQTPEQKILALQNNYFNLQCIRCHNPDRPKRLDLTNVENLNSHFDEILYRITDAFKSGEGQMPPRGEEASDEIVKVYKEWKKENTYLSLQNDFFKESCLRCHNPDRPNRLDLSLEENIIENYDDILYRVTEAHNDSNGKMPPRGDRPSEDKIQILVKYKKLIDELK